MIEHRRKLLPGLVLLAIVACVFFLLNQRSSAGSLPEANSAGFIREPTEAIGVPVATDGVEPEFNATPAKLEARGRKRELPVSTPSAVENEVPLVSHVVAAGETLTDIASSHETTVSLLLELNGLIDPHSLLIGQQLVISDGLTAPDALIDGGKIERSVIGLSAGGYPLESFQIGDGRYHVIVIGAIHGGYEWNTALLAYRLLTYFSVYPDRLPSDVTLHIIPIANPDGIVAVTGQSGPFMAASISGDTKIGRPNGNQVDLNRNWGCEWSSVGQWRQATVSGGTRPFSEPETRALRDYFLAIETRLNRWPDVVIWLHSAAGLVVPGNCNGVNHALSNQAAALYGAQAGYPVGEFGAYQVTGDAADWLAQHRIASFTVELTDHQGLDFAQNLAGLTSLLEGLETLRGN
jgi:LysM repeat protein